MREGADDFLWRVEAKVNRELYQLLKELAESGGLGLGEVVSYVTCMGLALPEETYDLIEHTLPRGMGGGKEVSNLELLAEFSVPAELFAVEGEA